MTPSLETSENGNNVVFFSFFPVTSATDFFCHLPEWISQFGDTVFCSIFHVVFKEKAGIRIQRECSLNGSFGRIR